MSCVCSVAAWRRAALRKQRIAAAIDLHEHPLLAPNICVCVRTLAAVQVHRGRSQDVAAYRRRHPLLRVLPPRRVHEQRARSDTAELPALINLGVQASLTVVAYLGGLAASRRDEYEADMLSLCLMRDAGGLRWECGGRQGLPWQVC